MAGEGSSNFEAEFKLSQNNYLKLQNNFNNLQIKYIEEKENSLNLEKKIFFLENGLKEKGLKQTFQQLIDEKMNEANDLFNKKIADLTNELEKLKKIIYIDLNFIKIENKWKEFVYFKCCENECIDTNYPIGNCIEGNGYVNLINDGNINYIKCVEGKGVNKESKIVAENSFIKPQNNINNSLYYFEIKCMKMEGVNKHNVIIGLKKCSCNRYTRFDAAKASILNEENKWFKVPLFSWKNNDVFGCGLVYPVEGFPYIFFTQNGKQIGKAILIKDSNESFKPYILLNCCSVETNFGNNLENKPFIYDFSKHLFDKY